MRQRMMRRSRISNRSADFILPRTVAVFCDTKQLIKFTARIVTIPPSHTHTDTDRSAPRGEHAAIASSTIDGDALRILEDFQDEVEVFAEIRRRRIKHDGRGSHTRQHIIHNLHTHPHIFFNQW